MPAVDIEALVTSYSAGTPPSDLATKFHVSPGRVKRILRERGVAIRPQGRPVGWRKLSPEQIEERRRVGLKSQTWKEYAETLKLPPEYNPRLDRRFGVRLACFLCGQNESVTTGYINGYRRQLCRSCKRKSEK